MNKKYFWIKLKQDFWKSKEVRKLRKIAGGDTLTIIYLEMLLAAAETDGYIYLDSIGETMAENVALLIDEDEDNVAIVIAFLVQCKLAIVSDESIYFAAVSEMVGKESESAIRMRKSRALKSAESIENKEENTPSLEIEPSQCDKKVTTEYRDKRLENREKSIESRGGAGGEERDESLPLTPKKEKKNSFGEFEKVKLTEKEHEKLLAKYGKTTVDKYIANLDEYIASKGKRYSSHYATILSWMRKDGVTENGTGNSGYNFQNEGIG